MFFFTVVTVPQEDDNTGAGQFLADSKLQAWSHITKNELGDVFEGLNIQAYLTDFCYDNKLINSIIVLYILVQNYEEIS